MNHQIHRTASWVNVVILALAFFCSNAVQAMPFFSDDFNPATTEANPTWRFYDPYNTTGSNDPGESTLTLDGTNALISIPAGLTHDLWVTPKNKAPRYLQTASDTNFGIEVKFETSPNSSTQSQGIIIQQDNDTFLRFDIFYGSNSTKLFVAYVDGTAYTIHKPVTRLQGSPKYQQVIRSGDQWTFRYSNDRATWTDVVTFTQRLTVAEVGFFAGTAGSNPDFLSSVDYFMDVDDPIVDNDVWIASAPIISAWYRYSQPSEQFGSPGNPQKRANVLGNVFSNTDLAALTYKLNGGAEQSLRFGPDTRRLLGVGDFNIEIDPLVLTNGSNVIEIKATDINGLVASKTVTLNYSIGSTWPLPYTADWGTLADIKHVESIAHVVDGLWTLTPNGIRSVQQGYDRTIAIGDISWSSNYEVTVPITPHSNFNGIGFGVGWQGHEGRRSPKIDWPLQALAWIRGPINNPELEIVTYGGPTIGEVLEASQPVSITKNETYMLKSSSESLGNGMSKFKVKFWRQNDAEPTAWNLSVNIPTRDGSVLLVDWFAGATFGNVEIKPLSGSPDIGISDTTPPVVSNIQASVTDTTATITWSTDEVSSGRVIYGLSANYGSEQSAASTGSTHSIVLNGLKPGTEYHYKVSSTDANTNTTSSTDLIFTTKASVVGNPDPTSSSSPSGMVSDAFDQPLDANVWSFYDPLGDSTLSMTGTEAAISVPAGTSHNLWKNALTAPRIRQAANDTDFEVEVKFDSALSAKYQLQGLAVEQDNTNLVRFDFYSDGSVTRIFSASFVNGIPNKRIQSVVADGVPLYLRVKRRGDQWTTSYSYDGSSWVVAGVYSHDLAVTSVAIFGGNAGSTAPAHNTLVDYFKVDGISQEVGDGTQQPPVLDDTQAPEAATGMVSDDFNHPLNTSVWTFFDPVGDSSLSETGSKMNISFPAGTNHNLWKNALFAPRIRQAANDTDFEIEVKFDSVLSDKYQLQGFAVEQDNTNLLRFDFYSDGSVTRIFSASFVDGIPTRRIKSVITDGVPLYLRVTRVADQWTMSYSYDGANWIVGGVYTHNLAVTSVAIFGGNAGPTLPEHTVLIDYFKVNNNL